MQLQSYLVLHAVAQAESKLFFHVSQNMLARNLESFHLSIESESCRNSCTIKGSSDPEQLSCAQVSEATLPIMKTWLMD